MTRAEDRILKAVRKRRRNRVASVREASPPPASTEAKTAEAAEFDVLVQRAARNAAERDCTLDLLAALVGILGRQGGYMRPDDQASLRGARALLAEQGWSVP